MEPRDQRERQNPNEEQADLVQPEGNHRERSRKAQRLDSAVKVSNAFFLLFFFSVLRQIESVSERLFSAVRSADLREAPAREKVVLPAMKLNCFTNHSASYIIKNSTGELFTYTPSGKVRTLG